MRGVLAMEQTIESGVVVVVVIVDRFGDSATILFCTDWLTSHHPK
jgi:hypothetical protein